MIGGRNIQTVLTVSVLILMYFILANLLVAAVWVICKKLKATWQKGFAALILVLALPVYFALFQLLGLMVNFTPSLPVGIYIRSNSQSLELGNVAAYCLDNEAYIRLAKERGYLGSGSCHNGLKPLLKEIGGMAGDVIGYEVSGLITVNSETIANSGIAGLDLNGKTMPQTHLTLGLIPQGQAFLVSRHAGGFDSRYFGLVDEAKLTKYRPLITF